MDFKCSEHGPSPCACDSMSLLVPGWALPPAKWIGKTTLTPNTSRGCTKARTKSKGEQGNTLNIGKYHTYYIMIISIVSQKQTGTIKRRNSRPKLESLLLAPSLANQPLPVVECSSGTSWSTTGGNRPDRPFRPPKEDELAHFPHPPLFCLYKASM